MISNLTDTSKAHDQNHYYYYYYLLWTWMLMLIIFICFLIMKIGRKFQYNLEPMYLIQLLILFHLFLFYVEVLVRSVVTMVLHTEIHFIIELFHFWILMNRNILLLLQQGNIYLVIINLVLKLKFCKKSGIMC